MLGGACLAVALLWEPGKTGEGHVFHEFFVAVWPVCASLVFAVVLYEFLLRKSFVTELISVSGPMVIQALRPRDTLSVLLNFVYGKTGQNRDVVAGVLGGFGEAADHHDLSISQTTAVTLTLADTENDPLRYELTISARYGFGDRTPPDDLYIFFVTTDPAIRDVLAVACDRPLFDFWYFPGIDDVKPELKKLKESFEIRLDYTDADGVSYTTEQFSPNLSAVQPDQWHTYLRIFREDVGTLRKLDPCDYGSSLAVLTFNFAGPLDIQPTTWHTVSGIEVTSTTLQAKSDTYCYWAAAYPCLVTEITFDVSRLTGIDGGQLVFRKVPFLLRAHTTIDEWSKSPRPLKPGTWLLAGHGVALIWKSSGSEPGAEGGADAAVTALGGASTAAITAVTSDSVKRIPIAKSVAVPLDEVWRRLVARVATGPFGSSADIASRRRDADRLTASLVMPAEPSQTDEYAVDTPWWRLAVAAARGGGGAQLLNEMRVAPGDVPPSADPAPQALQPPWLWNDAGAPEAFRRAFGEVIERTFKEYDGTGWTGGTIGVDDADLGLRLRTATESGWRLLSGQVPELLEAVGSHVACIAWATLHSSDTTFRSGSTPDLPGIVLLSADEAESRWYFPEAFLHEAAHCKFFDLCVGRNIVGDLQAGDHPWEVQVPWIAETTRRPNRWPVDQALAAAHAYLHVALLAGSLAATETDAAAVAHWSERCAFSTEHAALLLSKLRDAPISTLGPEGLVFVDWMQRLVHLVHSVATHVAQAWSGTGPSVRLPSPVKTLNAETSEYSLIGVVGTGNAIWVPADAVALVETAEPNTIGDLAMAKLGAGTTVPAEALVEALDLIGELDAMGIITFDQDGARPERSAGDSYDAC